MSLPRQSIDGPLAAVTEIGQRFVSGGVVPAAVLSAGSGIA